jgi:hypothetical protein
LIYILFSNKKKEKKKKDIYIENKVQVGLIVTNDDVESAVSDGSPLISIGVGDSSEVFNGSFLLRFHFIRRF